VARKPRSAVTSRSAESRFGMDFIVDEGAKIVVARTTS
jgi:hypothetical protein